jgi:single-stranded DNA-binding protein
VADTVQFLGSREGGGEAGGGQARSFETRGGELTPDPVPAFGPSAGDDDIPF